MPEALLAIDWLDEVGRQDAQEEIGLFVPFSSVFLQVFLQCVSSSAFLQCVSSSISPVCFFECLIAQGGEYYFP